MQDTPRSHSPSPPTNQFELTQAESNKKMQNNNETVCGSAGNNNTPQDPEPPIPLIKGLQIKIKEWIEWARFGVLVFMGALLLIGVIYNLFAPTEKDIPDELLKKLFSIIQSDNAYPKLLPLTAEGSQPIQRGQWSPYQKQILVEQQNGTKI